MKSLMKLCASLLLVFMLLCCSVSCTDRADATGLWEHATYSSDTTLGSGANTVKVALTAEGKTITLTLNTDKATLGEALFEYKLVNDASFFDTCNGIKADWEKDNAYWAFYAGTEIAPYGINDPKATTTGEPTYKIVYTK